jgi:hypothetical protein
LKARLRSLRSYLRSASFLRQWVGLLGALQRYWNVYGGWWALFTSPYVHLALILTILCLPFWHDRETRAADITLSAVPNLLGFSVGALAIVLAFSSADIFSTLAEDGRPKSFFMTLTTSLLHFILVQVAALCVGALAKITNTGWLDVVSLFLLFYAVLSTFAAGVHLFRTAVIYNTKAGLDLKGKTNGRKSKTAV